MDVILKSYKNVVLGATLGISRIMVPFSKPVAVLCLLSRS